MFVGRACLQDLGIISSSFPLPQDDLIVQTLDHQAPPVKELNNDIAPCGCLLRTQVPDPPDIPFEPTEENVPKLKQFLIDYYSTSTMKMCSHQKLPEVSGPPLHFTLKPDAVPVAVHTPATVPVHWHNEVKSQLDRDVTMGILEVVPPNEPTKWQHRMVVVRKHNGKPRRTVDMQALNKATLRSSHPLTSPYQKAMTVPAGTYKTVTDAWEGYHALPLDKESSRLTQFITPYNVYRYLRCPQGFQASCDAYNNRFDKITKDVKDNIQRV